MTQTAAPKSKKLKKSRRPRFCGHVPDETYELVTDFRHPRWLLFSKPPSPSGWVPLRLCHRGASDMKSNYWLSWSLTERRFAAGQELYDLAQRHPKLLDAVHEFLTDL